MIKKTTKRSDAHIPAAIDWSWVRNQVMKKERIVPRGDPRSREEIVTAVDECLRIARHLSRPRMISVKKSVAGSSADGLTLEGPLSFTGRTVFSRIRGSRYAHLFLATIGTDLEDTATMLMESGEELHGYLLDRIGSFAVESIAENFENGLRGIYRKRDMSVSMRLSPGYCDWPLKEQLKFQKALDFSRSGVRLTESCMMVPRKSISGLVGAGPKDLFAESGSQCDICNIKNCDYKRTASAGSR